MTARICTKCGIEKDAEADYFFSKSINRLYAHCKKCHGELGKRWRKNNPEKYRETWKKRQLIHKDECREASLKWYQKNKDIYRIKLNKRRASGELLERERAAKKRYRSKESSKKKERDWVENNRERMRQATRRWRQRNPEKAGEWQRNSRERMTEMARNWRHAHPGWWRHSDALRRARLKQCRREKVTAKDLKFIFERQEGKCANCRSDLVKYEIDHYMPIALGGSHTVANLDLLCRPCNQKKGAKHPDDWERMNGRDPQLHREPHV